MTNYLLINTMEGSRMDSHHDDLLLLKTLFPSSFHTYFLLAHLSVASPMTPSKTRISGKPGR